MAVESQLETQFWGERIGILGMRLTAVLDDPEALATAVRSIAALAQETDCGALMAASGPAQRVVDLARAQSSLSSEIRGQRVLIVDGLLLSGVHFLRAASEARAGGAVGIQGVALLADASALEATVSEFGASIEALEVVA